MFTRLPNDDGQMNFNNPKQYADPINLAETAKPNIKPIDPEWVDKLGYTPLISKSMMPLPRYGTTKEQLIQELLEIPYKGVTFQRQSTCQDKSVIKSIGEQEEAPSFWLLNDFLYTANSKRNKKNEEKQKHSFDKGRERVQKRKIQKQRSFNYANNQQSSWIIDHFVKDNDSSRSSDVIQDREKGREKYNSIASMKYNQLASTKKIKQQSPFQSKYYPKHETTRHQNQIPTSSSKNKPLREGIQTGIQTSILLDNTSKSIQCSIIKQQDESEQYSFSLPSQELNLSEIKNESKYYQSSDESIKQIESSLEERKSIQPIKITEKPKEPKREEVSQTVKKQPKKQIEKPKRQINDSKRTQDTKDQTNIYSKTEVSKNRSIQEAKGKKQPIKQPIKPPLRQESYEDYESSNETANKDKEKGKIDNVARNNINTNTNTNTQIEKGQNKITPITHQQAQTPIDNKGVSISKPSQKGKQEPNQNQPIKKSIDLLEQKRKRDKLIKLQEETNKKLLSIFDTKPINNSQTPQQNSQSPNSKISQPNSVPSKVSDPEQLKKNGHKQSNEGELSLSDMKSFHTKDASRRVFEDFANYHENASEEKDHDDFDSFENYESSSDGYDRRKYVLEEVKEEDENEQSLAQSKLKKIFEKPSQTKSKQQMDNAPSRISQQKSQSPSVQQSIVQQYHEGSPHQSLEQKKSKIPKMQRVSKKSQQNMNEDSFDLQHFIVKDIKSNVDELKSKMSQQMSEGSQGSIGNVFENFNKQIKYQDFKSDIDQLKNRIVTSNNL